MKKLQVLRSALVCGASVVALVNPSVAKEFNIPEGDLAATLDTYIRQSGVQLIYMDNVSGHKSRGAKGDLTETAALDQILRGTGFTARTLTSNTIDIVPQEKPVKLAQAAPKAPAPAAPQAGVETIVVTAQKKSEDIQQVPISVTALSQHDLTDRQIAAGPDLIRDVPNMNFGKTNFSGYSIELRGIGTQAISVTTDPAVAVAYNGTPFIRNHFFEQEFFDLDNVEVLRGPQGTLYGRNATAGVVNLIPALPTDQFEAMGSADIGNYMERRLEGMINLPIVGDQLDIRVAGEWTKRSGYTDDTTLSTDVDGRDLWSGRVSIGFKPTADLQTYLVWEHFSEDDDRLRSGKQLCATSTPPTSVNGVPVPPPGSLNDQGGILDPSSYLSQGCQMSSLYSAQAYGVPYGPSIPYVKAAELFGAINPYVDPYAETTQSSNLHDIQSAILPHYRAKNDILEFNADYKLAPGLMLTSQTGWNKDFLYSTEDYNRFDSSPGIFVPNYTTNSYVGVTNSAGVFCDPQLGCSNRLVAEDLNDETAWQVSQEIRLASDFQGPFNFNVGANYLHYVTQENYYVFINALTLFTLNNGTPVPQVPYNSNGSDNSACLNYEGFGFQVLNPKYHQTSIENNNCSYIDPNPISSINNRGHNYFLSQNPYILNSYAVFGETYYNILDNLKLTTGLRFTDDQKNFVDIPSEIATDGYGYFQTDDVKQTWDRLTGRAVLDWNPQFDFTDQSLIYASYSHGYKAGGANPPGAVLLTAGGAGITLPDHPLTFKPEYIEAFELGTKNTLLDGSLTLNGDIFYYNYTGYQISEIVDRTAINDNYNAHVEGAEIESNWEPLPGLKLNFAGGWEDTGAAGGDEGIDLMDRTAGNPNWMVVKNFPTQASNCILPTYVVAAMMQQFNTFQGDNIQGACLASYTQFSYDPVTNLPYVPNPTTTGFNLVGVPAGYKGFNPLTAPNNGEGFDKNLGGHALPNAPPFTVSFGSQYSVPLMDDWAATLRMDYYWQDESWARIFNDNPYDKLEGYTNVNLALILTSDDGWQVMGYVKNVFNVSAITGDFLNSDDSGLTTNVFLTDPRLYGVRVTKQFGEGDTGAMGEVETYLAGLFADTGKTKPNLWITLGGEMAQQTGQGQPFVPPFQNADPTSPAFTAESPQRIETPQAYVFDRDISVAYQPTDSAWTLSASIQYGRAQRNRVDSIDGPPLPIRQSFKHSGSFCGEKAYCYTNATIISGERVDFSNTQARESEAHAIVDFEAGKDVGLGIFTPDEMSRVDLGVRIAQFVSKSSSSINARPDQQNYNHATPGKIAFWGPNFYSHYTRFWTYGAQARSKRTFHGVGPRISWNDSVPLAKNIDSTSFTFDWGANAALLFGRRKVTAEHHESGHFHTGYYAGNFQYYSKNTTIGRSKEIMVPNLGGFAAISVNYQNTKVSFGYKGDFFFNAMDAGWDQSHVSEVGFFGPYANLSIGF